MKLKINGEEKEVKDGLTVAELLDELGSGPVGVAVELNREIVSRSAHSKTVLKEGDSLEIVRMVGGG